MTITEPTTEPITDLGTADEILAKFTINVHDDHLWDGWADHLINFKVGPATAELHSSHLGFRTVYSVHVKKKHRGQGHGRRLMDVIVAYAETTGCGLNLSVYVDNEAAVRLYTSVGFRVTGTNGRIHYMSRYPTRIPSTPEWDKHFEEKALQLGRDHEPRMGGDFWVEALHVLHEARKVAYEKTKDDRVRYSGSTNYDENSGASTATPSEPHSWNPAGPSPASDPQPTKEQHMTTHLSPTSYGEYTTVEHDVAYRHPEHITYWVADVEVYIHVTADHQATHTHLFDNIGRDGTGSCTGCGATAWSAAWVRAGYMGDHTHQWMLDQDRVNRDLVEQSAYTAVSTILGAYSIVIADLDPDQPARVGGKHRKGN